MAEAAGRNRLGEAVARAQPRPAEAREVASALFDEHLDLAAIRKALGQPRPLPATAGPERPDIEEKAGDRAAPPPDPSEPVSAGEAAAVGASAPARRRYGRSALAGAAAIVAMIVLVHPSEDRGLAVGTQGAPATGYRARTPRRARRDVACNASGHAGAPRMVSG